MRVHFILHETFEVPGAYLKWALERGHQITSTKVYEKEPLPETIDGINFLIVMGGPQSPDEDRENFPYYDPKAELAFMKEAIAADIYIVGVCLVQTPVCCLWCEVNIVQSARSAFIL